MLKSERVLISESIQATPINHAMYVRTCARAYPCTWPILALCASTYVARTIVVTKLWQCEKDLELVCPPPSFADILARLQGYLNKECLFVSKKDGSAMGAYLSVGA